MKEIQASQKCDEECKHQFQKERWTGVLLCILITYSFLNMLMHFFPVQPLKPPRIKVSWECGDASGVQYTHADTQFKCTDTSFEINEAW